MAKTIPRYGSLGTPRHASFEDHRTMKVLDRPYDPAKIKSEFKRVSWFYDFWAWLTEKNAEEKVLEWAEVRDGDRVLDVACGTGGMLDKIAALNPTGANIGVDLSPDMVAKAEKKPGHRHRKNFEVYQGNALDLDFPDGSFDLLVNNYMVDLLPEGTFQQVADEFFRVLAPGGRLVMSTFSFGTKRVHRFWFWVAKRFPGLLTGCRPVRFEGYLSGAGFAVEKVGEISQNTFPSRVVRAVKPMQ